jgi:thiamine-monophosphate kinase
MTRPRPRSLGDVGEHAWLASLIPRLRSARRRRRVLVGPGDDAAVLGAGDRPLVLTTDALVEGTHFERGWASPRALGRRAYRVAASDVAAMGATPIAALLAVTAPPSMSARDLTGLTAGVAAEATAHGAALVGGNLARDARLALTVTVLGEAPGAVVRRSGARPGEVVVVTGALGAAAAHLANRRANRRAGRRVRLPEVPDRAAVGVALAGVVSAMIDLSDGLSQDLGHVCRASGVGAMVALADVPVAASCRRRFGPAAPAAALTGGEDYELLATLPPAALAVARRVAARHGVALAVVGRIVARPRGVRVVGPDGRPWTPARGGFDHFR